MILKTTSEILDFTGKKAGDLSVGVALGNILASTKSDNPALSWQLGKKIATEEEVELKSEDIVFLKKQVSNSEVYTPLVVGQLLELLDK